LPSAFAEEVGARVLDDEPGSARERLHEPLVLGGERATAVLLGEVQVAEDRAADAHRNPEERAHRRVVRREAVGTRVSTQVVEPQGSRLVDQEAQDAPAAGQVADLPVQRLVDAVGDEVVEVSVGADDTQCAVPSAGQLAGRHHDAGQDAVQIEVGGDRDDGVEQDLGRPGQVLRRVLVLEAALAHGAKSAARRPTRGASGSVSRGRPARAEGGHRLRTRP
jgi:hypothetical protein